MDLVSKFLEACEAADDSAHLIDESECMSLPDLGRRASLLARIIAARDKSQGGNVAMLLPNTIGFVTAFWGILLAGKVATPLNFMLHPAELASHLNDSRASLLITTIAFKSSVEAMLAEHDIHTEAIYLEELTQETSRPGFVSSDSVSDSTPGDPDRPAVLIYTAGTSGLPKGVLLSHKNLLANIEGCRHALNTGRDDTFLGILPYFHLFGKTTSMLLPLLTGSRIILLHSIHPQKILTCIEKERVTALILVPTIYGLLVGSPQIKKTDFGSVRMAVSGGGPLPPALEEAFPAITGKQIYNGYGLTEASPVVSVNTPDAYKKGSIGRPLINVSVSVHNEDGQKLPSGRVGEFYVKGHSVMMGYFGRKEETRKALTPGAYLRTGDLGYIDEDGFLFITGRKKELIISGGENIYPMEIENLLSSHPAVEEVAVVGITDELRGEYPRAYVKLREGKRAGALALKRYCRERLGPYKTPHEFVFVPEFPKNALGKILKRKLVK